jgi:hypothetical protein
MKDERPLSYDAAHMGRSGALRISERGVFASVFSALTNWGFGYNALSKKVGPSEIQAQQSG